MKFNHRLLICLLNLFFFPGNSLADLPKSFRTFVTVKSRSKINLEIKLPDGRQIQLPQKNKSQETEHTVEVPFEFVKEDGFSMEMQMVTKGKDILPCQLTVRQLSQYNRSYVCRTSEDKAVREAVEIRVFTDVNSTKAEIPRKLLAFDR